MRARFYPETFARAGIALLAPREKEREFIHEKYIHELLKNRFEPATRDAILKVIARMQTEDGMEAVLAGTELSLLLRGAEPAGLAFLDTTVIHVKAAVEAIAG